jgi:penicillin-binding protein activator
MNLESLAGAGRLAGARRGRRRAAACGRALARTLALAAGLAVAACSKEVVRGANEPGIDAPAMSTGLDKADIQQMLSEALDDLRASPAMDAWRRAGGRARVAVFPFVNETSEHIGPQLDAILSEVETWLINAGTVTVISRERQRDLISDVEGQQGAAFDPRHAARYGRQLGAQDYITGKVQSADERLEGERRVQYFLFMQVIDVETGAIRWQHKSYITKLLR